MSNRGKQRNISCYKALVLAITSTNILPAIGQASVILRILGTGQNHHGNHTRHEIAKPAVKNERE